MQAGGVIHTPGEFLQSVWPIHCPGHSPPGRDVMGALMQGEELNHKTGGFFTAVPTITHTAHTPPEMQ